jgi:hypothetical protein
MPFIWKLPNDPPDPTSLERMKVHFAKPSEPMPYAWFMGTIDFFFDLVEIPPESLDFKTMARALHELTQGIVLFHMAAEYVPIWKDWYRFLLPYALASIEIPSMDPDLQVSLLEGCMSIYPQNIVAEYPGFRDDIVYTLGTRAIPVLLARDAPSLIDKMQNPLFNDIWYLVDSPGMEYPGHFTEVGLSMLFCLKYLYPAEIDGWVHSLLEIDSPQWRLALITWWLNFIRFMEAASDWSSDEKTRTLIETYFTGGVIKNLPFASLDAFIPLQNIDTFQKALAQYLTMDVFRDWAEDTRSHRMWTYEGESFSVSENVLASVESSLQEFETKFFAKPK